MKLKQIIQKWLINNWIYKILALVLAFVLWLVIVNIQDPSITKTISGISVIKLNEDAIEGEYEYTIKSGETATVVVTGKRSIVNRLTRTDFVATVNFEELFHAQQAIPISVELSAEKAQYASQLNITQKTMSMMLTLDEIVTRSWPVEIVYAGELPDNMVVDNTVTSPVNLEVTAPVSVLDTIYRVEATVTLSDVTDGASLRATPVMYGYSGNRIEVAEDMELSTDEITVTFAASYTKAVGISINTLGTPAEGYELTGISTSFDKVILNGAWEDLEAIETIRIPNTELQISGATRNVTVEVNLEDYLPHNVKIYDNNKTVFITAVIEKSAVQPTEAETEIESETVYDTDTETEAETEAES